jgi:pimeloyl-ACP methyl ester carboxylesterase
MQIREAGDPDGPPLVLVHGLGSSPRCWERNVAALGASHSLRLVDLFAGSDGMRRIHRPRTRFSLEGSATELAERLAGEDHGPATVIGHSMGGLVALHLATHAPGLVSRLVLVDVPAVPVRRSRFRQFGAIVRSSFQADAAGTAVVASAFLRTGPFLLAAAARATLRADLGEHAQRTGVPTLLVWGANDTIVPVEIGHRLAAAMPQASLAVMDGIGHQPMWEAPEAFHMLVAPFLQADVLVEALA